MTNTNVPTCRHCDSLLTTSVVDLGRSPLANDYADPNQPANEQTYELHARLCTGCNLVQVQDAVTPERLFGDYAYFSSYSASWLVHAKTYAIDAIDRFDLNGDSLVVEVASNDGYLLKNFAQAGIGVLGIEPAANVAAVAMDHDIPTETTFFGLDVAENLRERGLEPELVIGNNVFAHVPDINDFAAGLSVLAADHGVVSLEFPHLANLITQTQFDTIYHEHYSYLSLTATERILDAAGLAVFDVEQLRTHGGSLRVFASSAGSRHEESSVAAVRALEQEVGLTSPATYLAFAARVHRIRDDFVAFVREARAAGQTIAAYGAAAKGNTLLNYCGLSSDDIAMVADRSPHKQGRLLPGSRIPVGSPEDLLALRPDHVVILPWNLTDEIRDQLPEVEAWGGNFVVAVPELTTLQ